MVTNADLDTLRVLADRIISQVESGVKAFELVRLQFEEIAEVPNTTNVSVVEQATPEWTQNYDLAIARRDWFEKWYRKLGFDLSIPTPHIPDEEFTKRAKQHQALFYRPPTSAVSYEAFMKATGQGKHWTVVDDDEIPRATITWEPTDTGYWFWVEISEDCPRLNISWKDLTTVFHLSSLEEYVIMWWAMKIKQRKILDNDMRCWLRTRFGHSALRTEAGDGMVSVRIFSHAHLSFPYAVAGGRVVEVVTG